MHVHAPRNKAPFQWLSIKLLWSQHTLPNYDQSSLTKRDNTPSVSLGRGGGIWGHLSFIRWNLSPLMYFFELWEVKGVLSPSPCLGFLPRACISINKVAKGNPRLGSTWVKWSVGALIPTCTNCLMDSVHLRYVPRTRVGRNLEELWRREGRVREPKAEIYVYFISLELMPKAFLESPPLIWKINNPLEILISRPPLLCCVAQKISPPSPHAPKLQCWIRCWLCNQMFLKFLWKAQNGWLVHWICCW